MSTPDYDQLSQRIKLLAHPVRLRILDALRRNAECVCHLETLLDKPQPYVSQQLRLLRQAGVIQDEKDGQNVYYHLVDDDVRAWLAALLDKQHGQTGSPSGHEQLIGCPCPKCALAFVALEAA